ncbi:MAG: peptidoglycan DD-metalloendopeptidase family protein [Candidatus Thiodiazotropha sp. (ex Monitilora ramsayi)]|nr:peptidoglycan DD-metalloendopeptidase family protein [Candidatus Thiodiazotropha sp. (ex Monitilora ramsayi)]
MSISLAGYWWLSSVWQWCFSNLPRRWGINLWGGNCQLIIRVFGLFLLSSLLLSSLGCSSRGSAPVYSRSESDSKPRVSTRQASRPPHYTRSYYLVQKGDTLYSIAWRQNLPYQQLAWWNGIRPPAYQIFPGQRLRLKPPESSQQAANKPRQASTSVPRTSSPPPPTTSAKKTTRPAKKPSVQQARSSVKPKPEKRLKLTWGWPTKGRVVQTFSRGDATRKGVWIEGAMGQPVTASEAGKVVYAGNGLVGYGNLVIIKHDQSYLSAYGYNSKLVVREGDTVKRGEVVARMGSPNSGGQPVLHFEIRRQGKPVNPLPLLPRR